MKTKQRSASHSFRLTRLPDALLPASLLAASLFGQGRSALRIYLSALVVHLFSLGASHGIRAAFARQTSVNAVRGSVICAYLLEIIGFIILLFLSYFGYIGRIATLIPLLSIGLSLNIEHMFYEYLYAMGDAYSAAMCHGLTALFLLTGVLLDVGKEGYFCSFTVAAISAVVSAVIAATIHGLSGRINAQVIKCAPQAMLYSAFYPSVFVVITIYLSARPLSVSFFSGLIIYALCRTPYRRSRMESRSMNRFLFALSILSVFVLSFSFCLYKNTAPQAIYTTCGSVILASLCAFIAFGRI